MRVSSPARLTAVLLVVLSFVLLAQGREAPVASAASHQDPRLTRGFFVDPYMPAAQAAKKNKAFTVLGDKAQALWLTDYYPVTHKKGGPVAIKTAAAAYANRAVKAKKTPIVALYAIPDRDCGLYSAGGYDAATYKKWVALAAAGLKGKHAIAILEPDALPFYGSSLCKTAGNRIALLRYAAMKLHSAGVWVYIDAGHEGWQTSTEMAKRLISAGIAKYARGFSSNVGNYQKTSTETTYDNSIVYHLRKLGVTGKHFVIETARNGSGKPPTDGNDTCNPPGQKIGTAPRLVKKGYLDAYVWIKHPGESDGPCNGGPSSGTWWPEGALRLIHGT